MVNYIGLVRFVMWKILDMFADHVEVISVYLKVINITINIRNELFLQ